MNKLIRELAEQADAMDMAENELTGDTYCLNQIALKKFAELIVRECAKIADAADESKCKCEWIGGNIVASFGVK